MDSSGKGVGRGLGEEGVIRECRAGEARQVRLALKVFALSGEKRSGDSAVWFRYSGGQGEIVCLLLKGLGWARRAE